MISKDTLELARKSEILRPYGVREVLLYYALIAEKLRKYLKGKEIASKNWIPKGIPYLIKRGSKERPLFIEDFSVITPEFLELRKKKSLKDVKGKITKKQELLWTYFIPRKFSDLFYATNNEGAGKPIERIFFDVDRGKNIRKEEALTATRLLVKLIKEDKKLSELIDVSPNIGIFWTGSSFHVYIYLDKARPASFYEKYFQYSKSEPLSSFTGRWASQIDNMMNVNVHGGHEKSPNAINIDPSQTPSGKLARAPFSLHMQDANTIDGVALPLDERMLKKTNMINILDSYTPERVIKELDILALRLPKKFV